MYDVLIKNGTIIDGTGKERFKSDLGINNDKIVAVKNLKNARGKKEIDAKGKFVCPGFVDILNHSDGYFKIFTNPTLDSLVRQGITTIIGGNCGSSLAPLVASFTMNDLKKRMGLKANVITPPAKSEELTNSIRRWIDVAGININWTTLNDFFDVLQDRGISLNFGTLIGHSTIRRNLVGEKIKDLTADELSFFKAVISDSIDQGALGMSVGLSYSHDSFVGMNELLELATVLAEKDAVMAFHIRNESGKILQAVKEVIEIAKRSGVRAEISHLKVLGKQNWGQLKEVLDEIEKANEKDIEINFDFYPYDFAWSVFYPYLPAWISKGGREKMLDRLSDSSERERILESLADIKNKIASLIIAYSPFNRNFVGKSFGSIAREQGISFEEAIINVLIGARGHLICFDRSMSEDCVVQKLNSAYGIVASDGVGFYEEENRLGQLVHPRCFGAFARFLGKYVRTGKNMKWEKAIQKITSMPALKYGIDDRGFVQNGLKADLTVVDPDSIIDQSTMENPFQYAKGIGYVIVNGKLVVDEDSHTGELAGEIVKR